MHVEFATTITRFKTFGQKSSEAVLSFQLFFFGEKTEGWRSERWFSAAAFVCLRWSTLSTGVFRLETTSDTAVTLKPSGLGQHGEDLQCREGGKVYIITVVRRPFIGASTWFDASNGKPRNLASRFLQEMLLPMLEGWDSLDMDPCIPVCLDLKS